MKHIFSLLLISLILISTGYAAEKLVYLSTPWGAPSDEQLQKFKSQTGITVEVSALGAKPLRDKVMSAAAGKVNPADVIFIGIDDIGGFASSGILKSLDQTISSSTFDKLVGRQFFQVGGSTFAVPLYQQMVMIDLNKDMLAKINVKGEDITTWKEFGEVSRKLKKAGISEYPISFGVRSWSWYLMALSMGSPLFDDNMNPTFDQASDPGYKAFQMLIDFYNEGLISPERVSSPNPHPAFWGGQAAFHQSWQGGLGIANNPKKSKIAPHADYLLLPNQHYTWSLPAGLGISSYSENPEAAKKFIEFMATEEAQLSIYNKFGLFPSLKTLFTRLGAEGKIDGFKVMEEQGKYIRPLPYNTPWYAEFNSEVTNALKRAARGEQTVDQALKKLGDFQRALKKEYE